MRKKEKETSQREFCKEFEQREQSLVKRYLKQRGSSEVLQCKDEWSQVKTFLDYMETKNNLKYFDYVKCYYLYHFFKPSMPYADHDHKTFELITGPKTDDKIIWDLKQIREAFYEEPKAVSSDNESVKFEMLKEEIKEGFRSNELLVLSAPNNYIITNSIQEDTKEKGPSHVTPSDTVIHMYYSSEDKVLFGIDEGKNRLVEAFIKSDEKLIDTKELRIYTLNKRNEDSFDVWNNKIQMNTHEGVHLLDILILQLSKRIVN